MVCVLSFRSVYLVLKLTWGTWWMVSVLSRKREQEWGFTSSLSTTQRYTFCWFSLCFGQ